MTLIAPSEIKKDDYKIFLKISDKYEKETSSLRTIQFINNDIWNSEIGANYLGKISINPPLINTRKSFSVKKCTLSYNSI